MPLVYIQGDPPINRNESESSFWRFGEQDWNGVIETRASNPEVNNRGNTKIRQLEKRIVDMCMKDINDTSDATLISLLDKLLDAGGDANILIGKMPLCKHSRKYTEERAEMKNVYLLTGLLDRRDKNKVKILLEYGADVQLCTDWLVCQDLLYEYEEEDEDYEEEDIDDCAYDGPKYDPLVAMLEDCASYLPHEEDYIIPRDDCPRFNSYAPFVDNMEFLRPILQRHGSLYHVLCWGSDPSIYRPQGSPTLFRALDLDLVSLPWRWRLLLQGFTTIETDYIGWISEDVMQRGIQSAEDQVDIIGSRAHDLRQQLLCPLSIMIAAHHMHFAFTIVLLRIFRDKVIHNSGNIKLKLCGNILLQRIVDYILSNATDASIDFYDFLVHEFHANPNIKYCYECNERNKIQQIYENELIIRDNIVRNGFPNKQVEDEYLNKITIALEIDPLNNIKGKSILFHCDGNKGLNKFKYLVEQCHADPLLPVYREVEAPAATIVGSSSSRSSTLERVLISSPYHHASSQCMKSIIAYYFDKGYIPHIDACCIGNRTPLMIACSTGYNAETIGYLANKHNANVNIANSDSETAIMIAAKGSRYEAMVKLFKVYGDKIDLDVTDKDGNTLQEIIFEKGLYRASLRDNFPDSWKQDKADWEKRRKKQRTQR